MTIRTKPRASRPRRGRISSQTAGRTFRSRSVVITGLGFVVEGALTAVFRLGWGAEGFIFAGCQALRQLKKRGCEAALFMLLNRILPGYSSRCELGSAICAAAAAKSSSES